MKKCPYCAEQIQDGAIVCRYCGHDLRGPVNAPPMAILQPATAGAGQQVAAVAPQPAYPAWKSVLWVIAYVVGATMAGILFMAVFGIVGNFIGNAIVTAGGIWDARQHHRKGIEICLWIYGGLLIVGIVCNLAYAASLVR